MRIDTPINIFTMQDEYYFIITRAAIKVTGKQFTETRFTLEEIVPDSLMFPDSLNLEYSDL